MPLAKGHGREVVSGNIKEMIRSGYKPKQAIAASLANARKFKKMADGGTVQTPNMPEPQPAPTGNATQTALASIRGAFGGKADGGMIEKPKSLGQAIGYPGMADGGMVPEMADIEREDEHDVYAGTKSGGLSKNESMEEMGSHGPEDYQRSLNEIRDDGNYYPSEVANPAEQDSHASFAAALRKMAMSNPENYAYGGLVQGGTAEDEPVGAKPSEGNGKNGGMDSTMMEDVHSSASNGQAVMKDPTMVDGLSKDAMEAIARKKKARTYGMYNPK